MTEVITKVKQTKKTRKNPGHNFWTIILRCFNFFSLFVIVLLINQEYFLFQNSVLKLSGVCTHNVKSYNVSNSFGNSIFSSLIQLFTETSQNEEIAGKQMRILLAILLQFQI